MKDLLDRLNADQKQAVMHQEGPLVVFAGAGSGKTRVITTRIVRLIEAGVAPWEILAVTFTNKAAGEMRERIRGMSSEAQRAQISTFHSICARWLREFAGQLGFRSDFTIYDDSDSTAALKKVIKQLMPNADLAPLVGEMKQFMSVVKTKGLLPKETEQLDWQMPDGAPNIYHKYQEYLASCQAMDFGDLILNVLLLLRRNESVRSILQKRYRYVLIDEFQDTNDAQMELVRSISEKHGNIFVVGDDDQSIYSWRGAVPSNIINFEKIFPGAKRVTMAQNYRSCSNIVAAASAMIAHNVVRAEKNLFSEIEPGDPIEYRSEADGEMEAWYVVSQIKEELIKFHYSDFAIFYRTNAQSRLMEEALRRENIPYRIFGAVKFYDRLEIKDLLAYLRLVVNEDDDVSFKRVVNVPTRGIGAKAVQQLEALADEAGQSLMKTVRAVVAEAVPRLSNKFGIFVTLFETFKEIATRVSLDEIVPELLELTSYKDHLKRKYADQYEDKVDNIHELAAAISDFAERNSEATLADWLQAITLVRDEEDSEDSIEGVSMMSLHMSKGLEFRRVFVVGVEDGLIPHRNSISDPMLLEEERRLFYVGMTRAMEKLTLLSAVHRMIYNQPMMNEPSQFLRQIPAELIRVVGTHGIEPQLSDEDDIVYDYDDGSSVVRQGARVYHPSYGRGVVEEIEDRFGSKKAVVRFSEFGIRRVSLSQLDVKA